MASERKNNSINELYFANLAKLSTLLIVKRKMDDLSQNANVKWWPTFSGATGRGANHTAEHFTELSMKQRIVLLHHLKD